MTIMSTEVNMTGRREVIFQARSESFDDFSTRLRKNGMNLGLYRKTGLHGAIHPINNSTDLAEAERIIHKAVFGKDSRFCGYKG